MGLSHLSTDGSGGLRNLSTGGTGGLQNLSVISGVPNSVASRPTDEDFASSSASDGLRIETKSEWPSIGAKLSANTSNVTDAVLTRVSDGTEIDRVDVSGLSAGDAFTFDDVNLAANEKFDMELENTSGDFSNGYNSSVSFPYTTTDVDIIGRAGGGTNLAASLNDIGNTGF